MKKEKKVRKRSDKKSDNTLQLDSAWKDIILEHFEPLMEFFFEEIHRDIDFDKGVEFLETELRAITRNSNVGKRIADVLVKVFLKDGNEKIINLFIHIEVQGQKESVFMSRIYEYNYKIYDRKKTKDIEVISLAILTDEDENFRENEWVIRRWGFEHRLKIPIAKILDYKIKPELSLKLETSKNIFALVVLAVLRSFEARNVEDNRRLTIKQELVRLCFEKGYNKKQIESLLKFIDWLIALPVDLDEKLSGEIEKMKEEQTMPYITSWERIGIKKGKIDGKKEGKREARLEFAKQLLKENFSMEMIKRLTRLSAKDLGALTN